MDPQAVESLIADLPALDGLLRKEHIERGPDVWQDVYDLLLALARQGRLPADRQALSPLLGPLLCKSKEQQTRFVRIFKVWLGEPSTPSPAILSSSEQPRTARWEALRRGMDTRAKRIAACLILLIVAAAVAVLWLIEEPVKVAPPRPAVPDLEIPSRPPPGGEPRVELDDWVAPRQLPAPLTTVWQARKTLMGQMLSWGPWALGALWLVWRYWRRAILKKRAPDGDALIKQLRIDEDQPLFGGEDAVQAMHAMRQTRWSPTRRLDVMATAEATAKHAGYFQPRYRWRRSVPHYLVLVRSSHREDQSALLAEELVQRFDEARLRVRGYRFRDDPRLLIEWNRQPGRSVSLAQLAASYSDANLIVVSDGEILIHPLTGRVRPWSQGFAAWNSRLWLLPGERDSALVDILAQQGFTTLPLAVANVPDIGRWAEQGRLKILEASAEADTGLPPLIAAEPQRWLLAQRPPEIPLERVYDDLYNYLGADGLRLLQAISVYPEPRWAWLRALDLRLFPDGADGRERRYLRLSQLPWLRHAYMPDYLREYLLRKLGPGERRELGGHYAQMLAHLTESEDPTALTLPIAGESSRRSRPGLVELIKTQRAPNALGDSIFVNLLLGGRLGFLDFRLPRAVLRHMPKARWLLAWRPAVTIALICAVIAWGGSEAWQRWGIEALTPLSEWRERTRNAGWEVKIFYKQETAQLAQVLEGTFETMGFNTDARLAGDPKLNDTNLVRHPPGGITRADRLASAVAHAAYGAVPRLEAVDTLPSGSLELRLRNSHSNLAVFHDTLSNSADATPRVPFSLFRDRLKDGTAGPEMIVLPGGIFQMGCDPKSDACTDDEQPVRTVSIRSFAVGRFEVSFDDYDRYAKSQKRDLLKDEGWGRGRRPVIYVDWDDGQGYADWLSKETGRRYRLLTEAEWEYAARADTTTPWYWGADEKGAQRYSWYSRNSGLRTQPVGQKRPNPFGLYDMSGNVWEWTADCWHANYQNAPVDGTAWLDAAGGDCTQRVVRGGSWYRIPQDLRAAGRSGLRTDVALVFQGFRLARDL